MRDLILRVSGVA